MKKVVILMAVMTVSVASGCGKSENGQSKPAATAEVMQKSIDPAKMTANELAISFLRGIQNADKKMMYDVSYLTSSMVEDSRTKLTDTVKYKLTKAQRAETEHALRMSGTVDFYLKKLNKVLPPAAKVEIVKTTQDDSVKNKKVHEVKVTYVKAEDSYVDKSGKKPKEILVRLQQITHKVSGQMLHEFVFDLADFEKMADRESLALSYF